jgi:methylthioribose-1-phosphate isomerase
VRGAPAIGVAAAYGICSVSKHNLHMELSEFRNEFEKCCQYIESSRPTAVNLSWAIKRLMVAMKDHYQESADSRELFEHIEREAVKIHREDIEFCDKMGEHGLSLLKPGMRILTHCNAGALATSGIGTCLAAIHLGQEKGYDFKVYADETRPLLQGARLTSWELSKNGVDVTLICDNMAAGLMAKGEIDAVVVGCDRMAANGDGANKIGTLGVAVLAKTFGIPFYMYVPSSTIDMAIETGDEIEIEMRDGSEIYKMWYEKNMAPEGIKTYNPSFDVTPNDLITAVVTEKGVVRAPYKENLKKLFD